MFGARPQDLEAFLFRAPLQNIDVDDAHAPAFHFQLRGLVEIDCVCADQGRSIIVDDEFFARAADSEARPEREARPIRCRTHNVPAGQIGAEGVANAALFFSSVGRSANIRHSTEMRIGGFNRGQRFFYNGGSFGAAGEKTNNCKSYCKVKAF